MQYAFVQTAIFPKHMQLICIVRWIELFILPLRPNYLLQADGNSTGPPGMYPDGFCYKEQPLWSQYRESSFGHGTLDILNATHALW